MNKTLNSVLHITDTDLAGGRFNGLMLNAELPKVGIASKQAVFRKQSEDPNTRQIFAARRYFVVNRALELIEKALSIQSLLFFIAPMRIMMARVFATDLYHLHLIHTGFFSILFLPIMTRLRPTVWTMHDPWIVTGRCNYPLGCEGWKTGCGICPDLKTYPPTSRDHSAFMWWTKKWVYRFSKFEIVVASEHMAKIARQSPLLKGKRIHVVPFGINVNEFCPVDRDEARKRLGVFPGSDVLAFRINFSHFKGNEQLLAALRELPADRPLCLISFDARGRLDEFRGRYQIIELGWTNDENTLRDTYSAADIFLMPSIEEAFGMMAMESMACGTPVVVFSGTALPEVIDQGEGGIIVPALDSHELANAISRLLGSPDLLLLKKQAARALAIRKYELGIHIRAITNVYRGVFSRWHGLE